MNKRLNSSEKYKVGRLKGMSNQKFTSDSHSNLKTTTKAGIKGKTKFNRTHGKNLNLKMLYQNAVYKSLNLNLSPSTSSARSGTHSRDVSLKDRNKPANKMPTSTKAFEQPASDFKFHVKNDEMSTERLHKFRKIHNEVNRQKSPISKTNKTSQERQKYVAYSPSDPTRAGNSNQISEMAVENNKFNATLSNQKIGQDLSDRSNSQMNYTHNNLYMSYRRTSKGGLKSLNSGSKAKLTRTSGMKDDDTFESQNINRTHDVDQIKSSNNISPELVENTNAKQIPSNYKTKKLSNLNTSQSRKYEVNHTLDSARYSENSHKSMQDLIKDFLDAAAKGQRDKLDELLSTGKITDINVTDSNNRSALHYAVSEGRLKTIGFLTAKYIDINIQSRIKKETALHIACKKAYKKIIVALLNQNADPNMQDSNGRTSLHLVAELNAREHLVAFINHCKIPINWGIEDKLGRRAIDVPSSSEIKRLINTYMNTTTSKMYDRETRAVHTKKRGVLTGSNSRSRSKESGSVSKREFKYNKYKSPNKSPISSAQSPTQGVSNVVIYPARNESVQRMFKNLNRNKLNLYSIRKNIDISGSKAAKKQHKINNDRSLNSQASKNYTENNSVEYNLTKNTHQGRKNKNEIIKEIGKPRDNSLNTKMVSKTYSKIEPRTKIEMVKSSGNIGDTPNSSNYAIDNTSEFLDNTRRNSTEDDPLIVPKIEISLNE